MKLLYTLTAYPPSIGGAQFHQHQLARQMSDRHHIQVVTHWNTNRTDWLWGTTLGAPSEDRSYSIDGISVNQLGFSFWEKVKMLPRAAAYYPLMLAGHPPLLTFASNQGHPLHRHGEKSDLIHNVRLGREGLSYASYKTARKNKIPFVITPVHHPRWTSRRYSAFHSLYSRADAVLALTRAEKAVLMQLGVAEERIHVTGHGPLVESIAEPDHFLNKHNIAAPMVLFLGQLYPYKGYKELLKATAIVWGIKPETHFVFIGPDIGQSKRVFRSLSDNRIHHLGITSLQDKTNALAACSLVCVPSTQESFGGVYTEAFYFKKPVIACKIPAVSEVVTDGVDGFLVAQESKAIADKIITLLENDNLRERMGAAGKVKTEELYSWPRITERVDTVYRTLVNP